MKTPKQIAKSWRGAFEVRDGDVQETSWSFIKGVIAEAIEADRAQRGIVALIAEAIDDRGSVEAAELVRDTDPDDDLWNNYIGPMLDSIEADYTRAASGVRECDRCGDELQYLNSDDECDSCSALPKCDECDTRKGDEDQFGHPIQLNLWPNLNPPVQLCPSCTHNAYRSGWEPGE